MNQQIKIDKKTVKRICPNCGEKGLEWTSGKIDETEQEYICRSCRIYVKLIGMTSDDQDCIDQEAWE